MRAQERSLPSPRQMPPAGAGVTLGPEQGTASTRAVIALKQALTVLKLYDGDLDGTYDAGLADAVKQFEQYYGYAQDGIADPAVQEDIYARAQALRERFGDGEYDVIPLTAQSKTATVTADSLWLRSAPLPPPLLPMISCPRARS